MNCKIFFKLILISKYFNFRTHGFDSIGHQFDADGNLIDWWHNETKKTFKNRFKCMISEYSNLTDAPSDLNGNGTQTLSENIADNGEL